MRTKLKVISGVFILGLFMLVSLTLFSQKNKDGGSKAASEIQKENCMSQMGMNKEDCKKMMADKDMKKMCNEMMNSKKNNSMCTEMMEKKKSRSSMCSMM